MTIEERYRYRLSEIANRGPVTGLMLFGNGLVIFWARYMESWGPTPSRPHDWPAISPGWDG